MLTHGTRERGFSLIELIIAVALLGIVLGTVATASVINSNSSIRSQSKVRLASALEQAVESVHLEQPWLAASGKCPSMPCQYDFLVSESERFRFTATVDVTQVDSSTYDVSVALNAYDAGTNTLVAGLRPVRTSFIKDLRKLEHGDVIVSSCRVQQADERMAAGTCPIDPTTGNTKKSTHTPMVDPHGLPAPSAPNKSGNSWLLPPYQSYGKTSDRVAWEEVRADGRNRIYFYPNTLVATISGNGVNQTLAGDGRVTFTKLPRGTYKVSVTETDGVSVGNLFWDRKSTGHRPPTYPANTYKVVVTPGTQVRVTRLWEPKPVDVTMRVKTGDGAIHWEPRFLQNSVTNFTGKHDRAMLIPFPEGRVDIPGASNAEFKACPKPFKNTFNDLCDQKWGDLSPGTQWTTMKNVRPGIYKAYWYQSYNNDGKWGLKERAIVKKDLGFNGATRWNSTFGMHGRVGYVYVNPDGTVSTGNSSGWTGPFPGPSTDNNVAVRYPGCSNRRAVLTKLFSEVPDTTLEDGSKRWIYHSAANGKVYPPSLWDELSQSLKDDLVQYKGEAALGWVKRVDRRKSGGEFYSVYRAAIGNWNDAPTTTGWKWRRVDHMQWSGWTNSPGGQSYANAGYNVEYRNYTYSYVDKNGKTVWVTVPQYRYRYPVYAPNPWEPAPSPANQWIDRRDWVLDQPVRKHKWDIIKSQTVYKMTNRDYREPLAKNVLYRNVSEPVGVTEFNLFDTCNSTDKEFDADGEELT